MKNLTVSQLRKICKANRFIAVRCCTDNSVIGINCKVENLQRFKNLQEYETQFYAYYPIDFNEYISIKLPFLNIKRKHGKRNN